MKFRQHINGFSLIEVMIAVAIVGILSAVALPLYSSHVTRSKTSEPMSQLGPLRIVFEQYYQDNRKYGSGGACGPSMPATPQAKYFTYTCATTNSDQGYTITATGISAQGMSGYIYTIDDTNAKTSTIPGQAGNLCWVTKVGQTC